MTIGDISSEVTIHPLLSEIPGTQLSQAIPRLLPSILDDIGQRFDWDFLLGEYSTATVANQAEYTLEGSAENLGDIVAIRYDNNVVLQRLRRLDAYDVVDDSGTVGGVKAWYQSGISINGFPKVTLVDTPSEVKTLKVFYRKKEIGLASFPDHFQGLIVNAYLMRFGKLSPAMWESQLSEKIHRHKAGGKDYNPATIDPHMARTQRKISNLYGMG